MSEVLFAPVFTAEARALLDFLEMEIDRRQNGQDASHLKAVFNAVFPDIVATPERLRRLNNELVEWLMGGPRPGRDVEEAREEFSKILETQSALMRRILEIATCSTLPPVMLSGLRTAMEQTEELHDIIFRHWQPLTKADCEDALREIEHGEGSDLDEVIRELQSRVK